MQQRACAGWAGNRQSIVVGRRGLRAGESDKWGTNVRVEAAVLNVDAMRAFLMSGEEMKLLEGAGGQPPDFFPGEICW
jgi:hypothetical protein